MSEEAANGFRVDRRALARAFDRAAPTYDGGAAIQRRARDELLSRLDYFALDPRCILDLGAGTLEGARALQQRYPRACVLAFDLSAAMLQAAAAPARPCWRLRSRGGGVQRICADAQALPLAAHSVDLVFSSLMLQWCDRLEPVCTELARVLKPGGLLLFTTLGPETLRELRSAWSAADEARHVSDFPDLPQLGEALMHAGLNEPVLDVESHELLYPDAGALMRELKGIGAGNAAHDRPRGLTSRARLQRMLAAYERLRRSGGLPATYELILGAAFRARALARRNDEQTVPITSIGRRER